MGDPVRVAQFLYVVGGGVPDALRRGQDPSLQIPFIKGAQIKKAPSSGAENDGAKRNKQTAKGAEQNAETEAQPVIGRSRAGEAKQPADSRLVMVSSC